MGQFLRFALLIILVFIGFGTGICGLIAVGGPLIDAMTSRGGMDRYGPAIMGLGVVCLLVAVGCFFAVRALARRLRTHAAPLTPPADPPPAPSPSTASPSTAPPPPAPPPTAPPPAS